MASNGAVESEPVHIVISRKIIGYWIEKKLEAGSELQAPIQQRCISKEKRNQFKIFLRETKFKLQFHFPDWLINNYNYKLM